MDFQSIVDSYEMAAAVLSVEDKGEGRYGDIRIVRANSMYRKIMGEGYHDDMIYYELIPKESKFEDFCYRCAVHKQHLHAYVDTKSMGVWTDGTYIPLSRNLDQGNIHYFMFFFEFTKGPEADALSDVSMDSATFVIKTCIKLRQSNEFCSCMSAVNCDIQEKTDSFCSSIVLVDEERDKSAILCAKFRNDCAKIEDFKEQLTHQVIFSWKDTVKDRDNIIVKDEHDMDELEKINPLWAKSLRAADVKSLILVPLCRMDKILGYWFVTNFNTDRLIEIKEVIELVSFFISAEVANNNLMERLEFMSNVDLLTGLRNRNSMNYRVDLFVSGERKVPAPFGVIFADLNGLKQANDTGGHIAGDALLKKAGNLLSEVFDKDEIYRAGGDEFVVITPDCAKEQFERKVEEIRKKASYGCEVCFAIGSHWDEKGENLRLAMHLADEAMYADKNKFYEEHPDKARR
ncbi:GGDEF domain-containing protein [Treponema ruminis]|uniref:diguanylate cyclase n=1 Tax=Treponema ruminis TaxID=744515 RepID=A0A7W8G7R7_9SPIR|nr:GGDEF domain-containing protein [Treponema ruminis]MBB5225412.1 diguanylate cyclase (GGDEF)-like protein [Treponema ruminis]QSI01718.1 GGDEF domain-containing protein [Treponema ruminis]